MRSVEGAVGVALVLWGLVALLRHVRKVRRLTELIEAIPSEDLHHVHWRRCAEWALNEPASWLTLLQMLELRVSPVPERQ